MQNRNLVLAAAFALLAIAVTVWMLAPAPPPLAEDGIPERSTRPRVDAAAPAAKSQSSRRMVTVTATPFGESGIVRRADEDFPAPAPTPVLPAEPAPSISPRYTLTTQPDAATLARRLEGQPPLERDERIRVLPASAATDAFGTVERNSATAGSAVLLRLDATLHDPAAWVEGQKPLGEKQEAIKAKIAEDFAAEVATAANQPETAGKTFDSTWKDARAKANWEYQKFFGGDAANRAAMNAGRAAISKQ